jgi:translocation and assembly module TamB
MKILSRTLIIAFVSLVLILTFVSTTEKGLQLLWQAVQPLIPATLSIERVEGRLSGPVSLRQLKFSNEGVSVTLGHAELEWSPLQLFSGVLQLDRLVVEDLHYRPGETAAPAEPEPAALPERIVLPIAVNLEQLRVRNLAFDAASGAEAFLVQEGNASLNYRGKALTIRQLSVVSPQFRIRGEARIETAGDYPLDAVLDWKLSPPDYAAIEGHSRLSGTLERLLLAQTFNEAYPVAGELVITDLLESPSLSASIKVDSLALATVNKDLPALTLQADLRAEGPIDALALSGSLDIDGETLPPVHADLSARLLSNSIELELLRLTSPAHETEVRLSGPLHFGGDGTGFDLRANWSRARWPLDGAAQVESPEGQLHLSGTPDDYLVDSQMTLAAPGYTSAKLSLHGKGTQKALQVSTLNVDVLNGQLQGSARIAWQPRLETSVALSGKALDPGVILAEWPGQLDVQLSGNADFSSAGVVAHVPELGVTGTLRGLPLRLETQGDYKADILSVEKFSLVSGPSSLQLSGSYGTRMDLNWRIDSPDLSTLLPDAAGRLAGTGHLGGTLVAPLGRAEVRGSDLRYHAERLSQLQLNAAVDLSAATRSRVTLKLGTGLIQGISVDKLELTADGIPAQHGMKLTAETSLINAELKANGNWTDNIWRFDLQEAEIGHAGFAPWTLDKAVAGQLGPDRLVVEQSCWHSAEARLCLQGQSAAGTSYARLELQDLPLGYFGSLLAPDIEAQGTLALKGELRQEAGRAATARLRLDSRALALVLAAQGDRPEFRVQAQDAWLNLNAGVETTRLDGAMKLDNNAQLQVEATVSGTEQEFLDRRLKGRASIEVADIAFLSSFTPHVSDIQGSLQGDMRIAGSLGAPVLEGRIDSTDTRLTLDQLGITLQDVQMRLAGEPDGSLALNLAARSGDGQLTIEGEGKLDARPPRAQLKISGQNFQVMDTREAKISASPDLKLKLSDKQLDVEGEILIPEASIKPRKLPESSITVSPDQIIITEDQEKAAEEGYKVSSRVRFILGDHVRFDGFGLKGRIAGNLIAKDRPGKPTTASGELSIHEGTYRAYGQNLDIRTGRLLFAGGPVTEPGLDIEAVRRPSPGILVGVKARGSMRQPEFSLFSEPAMSQSDQLSWLVLGRPLESEASSQDRDSMNRAAVMLGLGGGLALTEQYGEKLGIDEISIESDPSDETNQASLLVGKYLSPKLFVSYGVGILEPVSTLGFRYALGSKWKLVGHSSALRSGADLFYVIEVGK